MRMCRVTTTTSTHTNTSAHSILSTSTWGARASCKPERCVGSFPSSPRSTIRGSSFIHVFNWVADDCRCIEFSFYPFVVGKRCIFERTRVRRIDDPQEWSAVDRMIKGPLNALDRSFGAFAARVKAEPIPVRFAAIARRSAFVFPFLNLAVSVYRAHARDALVIGFKHIETIRIAFECEFFVAGNVYRE